MLDVGMVKSGRQGVVVTCSRACGEILGVEGCDLWCEYGSRSDGECRSWWVSGQLRMNKAEEERSGLLDWLDR